MDNRFQCWRENPWKKISDVGKNGMAETRSLASRFLEVVISYLYVRGRY